MEVKKIIDDSFPFQQIACRAFDRILCVACATRDDALFAQDASFGRDLGYQGKICVAPAQVRLAHRAFSPTDEERAYARRLVDTYEAATARGIGTIDFEGRMVDGPLLKHSIAILATPREDA